MILELEIKIKRNSLACKGSEQTLNIWSVSVSEPQQNELIILRFYQKDSYQTKFYDSLKGTHV